MGILWKYFKVQRWWILLSLVLAGIAQLLTLIDPIIFGKIVDEYANNVNNLSEKERVDGVIYWLAIAVAIALAARLAKAFQEYFTRLAVQRFGMQIFNDGLKQTLRLSFQEYEEQRSGETLSVLQKVKIDTERFLNSFINILFSSIVGMGFLIWYSVNKNWLLVPVFVVGILVLGSLTGLLSRKIKTVQRTINRETNKMAGVITESLRNIELVKSLGLTFPEIRKLNTQTKNIYELEMLKTKRVRTLSFLQGTTLNILRQSILFILLWLIFRDVLTTGELITMQFISTSIFVPLQDLGNIILSYREVEASVNNFDQLMQKPIERRPEDPKELGPLTDISFDDVIFRHRSSTINAIDGVSFQLSWGRPSPLWDHPVLGSLL
ncbi:ABC transporter transmembrane domain-containing protein [Albibacterium profundi]|uniref:ABC transporter transmembrane domain-containing protein n=1 Tax=Albibacterium profundi TaxID=3134906 RepID=A0ABV5CAY6_9SPHI